MGFALRWRDGYNPGYTEAMKTAISLPDELFEQAEAEAQKLGVSRSELYARALSAFVLSRHGDAVTERLNRVYADESSEADPVLLDIQLRSLPSREKW